MKNMTKSQIERLLVDISSIKEVISRNRPVFRQLFDLAQFRWFLLMVGLSTIGFCMLIFIITKHYGSFGSVPNTLRIIIYIALAITLIIMQIWKGRAYLASARQMDRRLSLGWLLKEFYSSNISHVYVSIVLLLMFFTVFFIVKGIPYFIIPTFSIGIFLISICYSVILQFKEALMNGYWFLLTGICTIIFPTIPSAIAISLTLGCGMLMLSFTGFLSFRSSEED